MNQSIGPQPTIILPSVKNGRKIPTNPPSEIGAYYLGVTEDAQAALFAGDGGLHALGYEVPIVGANIARFRVIILSDGTLRIDKQWGTTFVGTIYE